MHVVHLIPLVREIIKSLQYIYISYTKMLFKVKTIPTQYYCTVTIKTYFILKYDVCLRIVKNTTKLTKKSLSQKLISYISYVRLEQ